MIPRLGGAMSLRSRTGAIAGLLLVTLGVSIAIGWEARRAAAAERRTAEGVLRDYAGFAASEYVRTATRQVHMSADLTISQVTCALSRGVLSEALQPIPTKDCDCGLPIAPLRTVIAPDADGLWVSAGEPLDQVVRAVLVDGLRDGGPDPVQIRFLSVRSRPSVVVWRTHRRPRELVGAIVADASALQPILERPLKSALLPATLLSVQDTAHLLALRVATADGSDVFTNQVPASNFSRSVDFAPSLEGLSATASLTPEAAEKLIIGGLPRSRMPMVYGLIALCILLVTLAAVQLSRQAALARLRTDFVAGVSHELRTPLSQIRMFAETLALDRVRNPDEHRESLNIIVTESQRLSHLVDKVLSFARLERRPKLDGRDVNLSALIHETTEAFVPVAAARDSRLQVTVEPDLSLRGDPASIRQVLLNLLDNAVKYGREGQVVRVNAARTETGMLLTVDDEGPGVAAADRRRIWEPFWRATGSEQGGSGIGLAIVQQIVAMHGGEAWVERAASGGARFSVLLPAGERGTASPDPALQAAGRPA